VTDRSQSQPEKHSSQITSTDAGRWIDASPLEEKADPSIRDNSGFDPNEIDSSDLQSEKHFSQITLTDAGR
jgi:hypothetical protein